VTRALHAGFAAAALIVALEGCGRSSASEAGESPPAARAEGPRLILDPGSPQLAALATAPVVEAAPLTARMNGRLAWNEDVTVRIFSPFAGRVLDVRVDVGRRVAPSDALATIAAPDFGQAQADARRAAADLALAERTATRMRDLLQHGVVAQKDVDAAEADLARARAEQQRADARLRLYGGDSTSVTQVFALRTPLGGTVVERNINPGQEVRPDQMLANAPQLFAPLFVVTDPSRLWIQLDVPERYVSEIEPGAPLDVRALAFPDRSFPGTVVLISGAVDPTTRTVKVRGTVANHGGLLKAEMLATATATGRRSTGPAVPAAAVLLDGDAHVVFVEEARGRYRRCQVQVGLEQDGQVPVTGDLRPGERVVTGGSLLLEQLFQLAQAS
jgi:cobalt-zinc-cadmium efflux system membrane fusion protein